MVAAERSPATAGAACEDAAATAIPEGVEVEDEASIELRHEPESVRSTWSSRTEDDGDGDVLEAEIDLDIQQLREALLRTEDFFNEYTSPSGGTDAPS